MKIFYAMLTWAFMGTLLGTGIYMVSWGIKGGVWVLALVAISLILAVAKIGCVVHD
jgi:hypothetical protein